ncbi:hypothetical protein TIFTF001_049272 [Ficus carica]|nr:hypothetical protein TIFTF001_049272 [Ficus carica]
MDALDDLPEDPPLIVISSDDEDPEELPLEDGEADSNVSAVTIIDLD